MPPPRVLTNHPRPQPSAAGFSQPHPIQLPMALPPQQFKGIDSVSSSSSCAEAGVREVCLLLAPADEGDASARERRWKGNSAAAPVNLTWIVLIGFAICGCSLFMDELLFAVGDGFTGVESSGSSGFAYMPGSGSDSYSSENGATAVLNALSVRLEFPAKSVVRAATFCACFVVLTVWSLSLYIKLAFLRKMPR